MNSCPSIVPRLMSARVESSWKMTAVGAFRIGGKAWAVVAEIVEVGWVGVLRKMVVVQVSVLTLITHTRQSIKPVYEVLCPFLIC